MNTNMVVMVFAFNLVCWIIDWCSMANDDSTSAFFGDFEASVKILAADMELQVDHSVTPLF